ncbi:uncharacterized protein PG998_006589 [Apiospora kogelbergensis]|uniref:uncharacterized protein n=1 Tax=Apiospora kogelbergensis TaxID=1337665 RepID=UPI00312CF534
MSNTFAILSLLASFRAVSAAPVRWPPRFPTLRGNDPYWEAKFDHRAHYDYTPLKSCTTTVTAQAADETVSAQAAGITQPPALLTISLVNSHAAAISTTHNSNAGAPSPVSGPTTPGTLAAGATAAIAVPTDWAGVISVNDASHAASNGNSLIEANYQYRTIEQYAIADLDVSYVIVTTTPSNGFTLPITCSCNGLGVTGCNKDLFTLGSCPVPIQHGACPNPLRSDTNATTAHPFFAPCQHAAYTYPNDNTANSQNECHDGQIVCCVGAACPPSYKQTQG